MSTHIVSHGSIRRDLSSTLGLAVYLAHGKKHFAVCQIDGVAQQRAVRARTLEPRGLAIVLWSWTYGIACVASAVRFPGFEVRRIQYDGHTRSRLNIIIRDGVKRPNS